MRRYLLKLYLRRMFKTAAYRSVAGRYWDRHQTCKGRLTRADVDRILAENWRIFDQLLPKAPRYPTVGNRQNVMLAVGSVSMYRALKAADIEPEYATELFADMGWKIYEMWIVPTRFIARLLTRDPQKQMNLMIRMFLIYPFSRPGYDSKAREGDDAFALDIFHCPPLEFAKLVGEAEFFAKTWCSLDFALAQVMTRGGRYERPHTLSVGDEVCDMKWYG